VRQVAVTCRCGTSVARSPKLLALPYLRRRITIIILSTNRSYVISPCVTNSSFKDNIISRESIKDKEDKEEVKG
jgi:hypothetical protein